jgi:hypothetical protein
MVSVTILSLVRILKHTPWDKKVPSLKDLDALTNH